METRRGDSIAFTYGKRSSKASITATSSVPEGFFLFSEQMNGRAAMFGFFIAIATEARTGQEIIRQRETVGKTVENVIPF